MGSTLVADIDAYAAELFLGLPYTLVEHGLQNRFARVRLATRTVARRQI
jgi:hypothetical protein